MPKKRVLGLFSRLGRLKSRVRRLKAEVSFLAQVAGNSSDARTARELKLQLRDARDQLRDVEDLLEPMSSHVDQPIGAAAEPSA
jgi:hypothetical protein